ncbi:hypothetical protein AB6A40_002234 [Gnathostoma spinigerum]|uniref:Arf-GAP domain-containing protein n=1 Tax=Gnathostoma spinigerum TaxID=75299 RepID=A0ABD6EGS7_9BILA
MLNQDGTLKEKKWNEMASSSVLPGCSMSGSSYVCADCGAEDPQWASLNKGVLICSECCYVHRNLGRHISYIRSLKKGVWDSTQLELMYVLYSNGSNNIWEHSLVDPQSSSKTKRKPTPQDPVLPIKENFIKAKYAKMAFTLRPSKEDEPLNQDDLNQQLWSCVRTSHVETTLRLLALGADPNYVDPDKQNAPLHIAAKSGQALQVELLWIYGADIGQINAGDLSPAEVAKLENHTALALRLKELEFEVTTRLTMYLCGRKPDIGRDQYFLIPELIGQNDSLHLKKLRNQLQTAPAHYLERMVQDIYDEVDRRETGAAWSATLQSLHSIHFGNDQCIAVFLPPNPELSATRNQLRQKLAKCDVREFATLIIDVLTEIKRRFYGLPLNEQWDNTEATKSGINRSICDSGAAFGSNLRTANALSRDYDDVAEVPPAKERTSDNMRKLSNRRDTNSSISGEFLQDNAGFSLDDYLEVKDRLLETEHKLSVIQQANAQILRMISRLQSNVDRLNSDSVEIQTEVRKLQASNFQALIRRQPSPAGALSPSVPPVGESLKTRSGSASQLCVGKSAIEPLHLDSHDSSYRTGRRHMSLTSPSTPTGYSAPPLTTDGTDVLQVANGITQPSEQISSSGIESSEQYERITNCDSGRGMEDKNASIGRSGPQFFQHSNPTYPDQLIARTEQLTSAIKALLIDAKYGRLNDHAPEHAHTIAVLVSRMVDLIPDKGRTQTLSLCLQRISDAVVILSAKCNAPTLNVDETCKAAFSVGHCAKQLLVSVYNKLPLK